MNPAFEEQIGGLLQHYVSMSPEQAPSVTSDDFVKVADVVPRQPLAESLADALRSNQTPALGSVAVNMFEHLSNHDKKLLLDTLVTPIPVGSLLGLLHRCRISDQMSAAMADGELSSNEAATIEPDVVRLIAACAEQHDNRILERVSEILAERPSLAKDLGPGALAVALESLSHRL